MTEINICQICGSAEWMDLPDPNQKQSVTTASRIIGAPLGKSQCSNCGLVQRIRTEFLGFTDYYENDYASYYERPGTNEFHKKRYNEIVGWMDNFLKTKKFEKVIDVGCGQGWAMDAFKELHKESNVEGLEPSHYNVKIARDKGYTIHEGKLEDLDLVPNSYDLVFSNNVIQHVNNARDFLTQLKSLVSPDGVIVITCPDGSRPNIELLWSDQNFSFLPMNLIKLAADMDFKTVYWTSSSDSPSLPPAQLLVLTNNPSYQDLVLNKDKANIDIQEAYELRKAYLSSFEKIQSYLIEKISGTGQVYNFGASYWTSVMAAYCPDYWNKVSACLVDCNNDLREFLKKDVLVYNTIENKDKSILVIGTSPGWQTQLKAKLESEWEHVITWESFINY